MKTASILKIVSVAAMFAMAGPVLAQDASDPDATAAEPGVSTTQTDPLADETGMTALGIDISAAGTSTEATNAWLATQTPEVQAKVTAACANINANPTTVHTSVASFCKALAG